MKNILLIATYFISYVPCLLYGTKDRAWLSVMHARPRETRLDMIALYYGFAINFFILAYCLHNPKGISKVITQFVLIITSLDLIHLFINAKQGFEVEKLILAFTILGYYQVRKKTK